MMTWLPRRRSRAPARCPWRTAGACRPRPARRLRCVFKHKASRK
jgi:hypothetical protein